MLGPDDGADLSGDAVGAAAVATPEVVGDKNQRANIFQIATRQRTFVVEVRDLVDNLSQSHLERFGQLVLFGIDSTKLGTSKKR